MIELRAMSTLIEIEAAAEALTVEQKRELFLFLAARLQTAGGKAPAIRDLSRDRITDWIADDEAGMRRLREGL